MIGQNVGNYRIKELLGEGGMGTVYLAEHPGLGRQAAVKVLHAELARSAPMIQRFFNEARAANAVGHPGIVEVWDFGTLPSGEPYLMMELLRGRSLAARMRLSPPLPVANAVDIADQAAGALGAAHAKGVVHRDLKPDNLFLIPDPNRPGRELVKILDFGIAKLLQPPDTLTKSVTRTGVVLGTPIYMSPEQCRASKDVDHRSDIYSLGIILYEMLSGAPPFSSDSWGELVHMHIGVAPPALRSRNADLAEGLERIVGKMLEKDPAARFPSMAEFQQALTGGAPRTVVLEDAAEPASPSRASPTRRTTFADAASEVQNQPTVRLRRWLLPTLAGAFLSVAATVVMVMAGDGQREVPIATEVAPPIAVPAPPRVISVDIVTVPEGAQVIRESTGEVLGQTPLKRSWPNGSGVESLRLEREGHRAATVVVPLDRGVDLKIDLQPLAPPAPPVAAPKRRPAAKTGARPPAPEPRPSAPKPSVEPLKI